MCSRSRPPFAPGSSNFSLLTVCMRKILTKLHQLLVSMAMTVTLLNLVRSALMQLSLNSSQLPAKFLHGLVSLTVCIGISESDSTVFFALWHVGRLVKASKRSPGLDWLGLRQGIGNGWIDLTDVQVHSKETPRDTAIHHHQDGNSKSEKVWESPRPLVQAGHMFGKGNLCLKAQSLKINCCSEASQASLNTTPFSQHRHDRYLPALSLGRAFHADQGICKYLHEIQRYQGGRDVKRENPKSFLPTLSSTSELPLAVASIRKKTCICQKKQHRKGRDQSHETPTSTFLMSMPRAWDSNAIQNQAVFDICYIQQ